MVYLIVATETRNGEYDNGKKWVNAHDYQIVLGSVKAKDYEDALEAGACEFGIAINNIDAYELTV